MRALYALYYFNNNFVRGYNFRLKQFTTESNSGTFVRNRCYRALVLTFNFKYYVYICCTSKKLCEGM